MPDNKLDGGGQIARMQVLKLEGADFVDRRTPNGDPVEEGTARQIKVLAKHVLIQRNRGDRIAAQGVLEAGVERQSVRAQMQHRRDSAIEHRVVGIAILNYVDTGQRNLALGHAFADEAADRRKSAQMDAIMFRAQYLHRMARRRQKSGLRIHQLRIQRVNIDVFEHRSDVAFGRDAERPIDLPAFLTRKLIFRPYGLFVLVLALERIGAGEAIESVERVLADAEQIGPRPDVGVNVHVALAVALTVQPGPGLPGVPLA